MKQIYFFPRAQLAHLFTQLQTECDRIVAPTVQDHALAYREIDSADQLPWGYRDYSEAGRYRLEKTESDRCFDWVSTAQGLKPWVFLPDETIWHFTADQTIGFAACEPKALSTAIIGARACDLAGLALQDKHFIEGEYLDPRYQARRENLFIVAVNCQRRLDTCFCVSTGDGPEVTTGHDLVLDELENGFLISSGSDRGEALLDRMAPSLADDHQLHQARESRQTAKRQSRALPSPEKLQALMSAEVDESRWEEVASRCLSCGNCTAVCPTCFCFRHVETANLDGDQSTHLRQWDSCFSDGHGHMAGIQIRNHPAHKYRQWMMHKLVYWHVQYGRSGCTGCGRCITWCPAAIDLVLEAKVISRQKDK